MTDQSKEWFDAQRNSYLNKWAHERLRAALGVTELKSVDPKEFTAWAQKNNLAQYLPLALKNG